MAGEQAISRSKLRRCIRSTPPTLWFWPRCGMDSNDRDVQRNEKSEDNCFVISVGGGQSVLDMVWLRCGWESCLDVSHKRGKLVLVTSVQSLVRIPLVVFRSSRLFAVQRAGEGIVSKVYKTLTRLDENNNHST